MSIKDKLYDYVVRKNENVRYEYERYVMEHTIEHYENRGKHWKILWKLNWHYRVKKKNEPMLYFETYKIGIEQRNNDLAKGINNEKVSIDNSLAKKEIVIGNENRLQPFWLAKRLLTYDVISFDIFDTLLFRGVKKPEDVFILLENQLGIVDFVEIRKNAEKKVREINKAKYGNHEVSLKDIYKEIEKKTGLDSEIGMKVEIDTEYELIFPNTYMKCVYDILKAQGKKIIAVSDMYLSTDVIRMFLVKCGYEIDELYVSADYYCNKRDCGLYKQVLGKYSSKKIVHIGDNYKTDIENARNMGIDAVFYRNCNFVGEEKLKIGNMSELVGSVYSGLINTTMFNGMNKFNPYFEYGYLYGGLYILGFCNWIKNQAKKDGVEKILFLARDGFIYQKVFEMITDKIETEYVYWSRIASVLGNIESNKYDFIKRLVDHKAVSVNSTKILDVLNIIGISAEDINLKKYGLEEKQILCESNKAYFEEALLDNFEIILELTADRNNALKKMLEDYIGTSKKVAVVDVGWTGSSVLAIKNIIENKSQLNCKVECYLAASKVKGNISNLTYCMDGTIKTYMFSQIKNRILYDYHVSANKGSNSIYFELFTQACMPSFKGISEKGNLEFDVAEVENYEMIAEIHEGIMYFAKQYMTFAKKFPILLEIAGNDAYQPYKYISANINYIRKHFKNFSYARGVGGDVKIETIENIMNSLKL